MAIVAGNNNYTHLAANATTVVKSSPGILHSVTINTKGAAANTVTLFDNTAGSGTIIAIIDSVNLNTNVLVYDIAFAVGLTAVIATGTAADITVAWQ